MKNKIVIFILASFVILSSAFGQGSEDSAEVGNLKNITRLFMEVNIKSDQDLDKALGVEISDLVELLLRRKNITPRPASLEDPKTSLPRLVITFERLDSSSPRSEYSLTLTILDQVTIKRNNTEIIAETYRLKTGSKRSSDTYMFQDVKNEVRALMQNFIDDYRQANNIE